MSKLPFFLRVFFILFSLAAFAQTPSDVDTVYRTVQLDDFNLQAVVTKPKDAARHPAVLVIGGLGCYSFDNLKPHDAYYELLYGLTRRGYVTMRVEKNGEGKSQGPPCDSPESDLQLAVRRSVAGLNALAGYDFVDREKIFILAHSIGPLEGVLAAQKFPVRGFIAAETIGKPWFEYEIENTRRQSLLVRRTYDAIDRLVRQREKCQIRFFFEKQTPEQIVKDSPECKEHVQTFGVSYTYLQQIADLDPAVEWKKVNVPVLVTYGTSDPTTSAEENRYLAEIINSFHPGRATYLEFPGMGHGLYFSASQRAFLEDLEKHRHGDFDRDFLEKVADWLDKVISANSAGHR